VFPGDPRAGVEIAQLTAVWKKLAVALLALVVVIGLLLLIAQDQEVVLVEVPYAASDEAFPSYAAAVTGTAITTGNRFRMLLDGEQIFPRMLEAIREARERVNLETYIYKDGEVAAQFDEALEAAARRGVTVNIVFDALGSPDAEKNHARRLEAAGARIAIFNKPAWYALESINYRTHRKILVVDGRIGFTGGVGMSDDWIGSVEDGKRWRDTQFEIDGPAVRYLEGGFAKNLIDASEEPVTPILGNPLPEPGAADQTLVIWSSPTGGSNGLKMLYLLSIAAARRTIDIASPYFLLDESTEWALSRAVERGVRVRVLVESEATDAKPVKYSSRAAYDRLLEKGLEIHEYQPTLMHAKTLVVDDAWVMFGSANFDNRSLELNDELNVATLERQLAADVTRQFETDLASAVKLDLASWRQRPRLDKIREWIWSHFSEVF
jgi:cardiolipin synthase A/B